MDTKAFEQLIEGAAETQRLDFKESCPWDAVSLAKDLLAMSNMRDGGYIVIGIKENPFARSGVTVSDLATYEEEKMRDQISSFADPAIRFRVFTPKDKDGKTFVVIRVFEFSDLPIICARDSKSTTRATIYYRNGDRRIESAAISNAHDFRDLVSLAAVKMMHQFQSVGLRVDDSSEKQLNAELQGL